MNEIRINNELYGGNTISMEISEEDYIKLEDSGEIDPNITYYVFDGNVNDGSSDDGVNMDKIAELYFGSIEEREALANAINDKGVSTNITDSLMDMAEHVTHIYEGGNALAEHITEGYSAWVNGVLIEGTRPIPLTQQTGSFTISVPDYGSASRTVQFPIEFLSIPTVSATTSYSKVVATASNITTRQCVINFNSSSSTDQTVTVTWIANGEMR